jgi:hypothetical protein
MKNIERLTKYITKNGTKDILIHTIPQTKNWIICQKIEIDKWILTLCDPMGNVTYNLGTVSNKEHINLWMQIIKLDIETKVTQIQLAKELKERVYKFTKKYETYQNFIKNKTNKKTSKNCKKRNRSKKSN